MGWKKVNKEGRKIKERATGRKAIKLLGQRSWAFENMRGVAKLSSEKVKLSSSAVSVQVSDSLALTDDIFLLFCHLV